MKTIEQFKAEQNEAMEKALAAHTKKLERAAHFANLGLPIPEYIADGTLYGAASVTYRNNGAGHKPEELRSMGAAVALFAQFAEAGLVVAAHVLKNGCTIVHPESLMKQKPRSRNEYKRDTGRHSGAYAAELRASYMHESRSLTASLDFFAILGGQLYGVCIQFGQGYIGKCPRLIPEIVEHRRNYTNRLDSRTLSPNRAAYGMADSLLKYSTGDTGPVENNADHRYLFIADDDPEDAAPVGCTHALAQLKNLAAHVDQLGAF